MSAVLEKMKMVVMDAQPVVRDGLRMWINAQKDMIVAGAVADPAALFALLAQGEPAALVLDVSLGEYDGIAVLKTLRERGLQFPVIIFTAHDEALYARLAFEAGAHGYLTKTCGSPELIAALRRVRAGQTAFSAKAMAMLRGTSDTPEVAALSEREREIFVLMGQRLKNREIAERLGTSIKTVESHKWRMKQKFGPASSMKDLDAKAFMYYRWGQTGPIEPPSAGSDVSAGLT